MAIMVDPSLFKAAISKYAGLEDVAVESSQKETGVLVAASCGGKTAAVLIPFRGPEDDASGIRPISSYSPADIAWLYSPALTESLQRELQVGRYDRTGKTVVCSKHWNEVMEAIDPLSGGVRGTEDGSSAGFLVTKDQDFLFLNEVEDCPICKAGGVSGVLQPS